MKRGFFLITCIMINFMVLFGKNPAKTNRIIVKLKENGTSGIDTSGAKIINRHARVYSVTKKYSPLEIKTQPTAKDSDQVIYFVQFPEGTDIEQVIDEIYKTDEIEYAEPDYLGQGGGGGNQSVVPNDQYYYRQWGLKNNGTFSYTPCIPGSDIEIENAWNIEQGDSNVVVGIIDTGAKLDHPEFKGRIWANKDEIPNNMIDDDLNGYVDDVNAWDFANNDNNPTDDYGHGTNVSGIIGALANNSTGFAGIDWNCKLMILKALDSNDYGYYSWWISAIYYAVKNGAKVINMSFGGTDTSISLENAINYALSNNVVIVACMMNTNSNTVYYPAGFTGVIAVGSTNPNDERTNPFFWSPTSGSNYGSHISVVAPGNYIFGLNYQSNTNYGTYWGGTSQATPFVSGLAALLLAQDSTKTPAQIKKVIENTAEDKVGKASEDISGWDQYYGYGRINAYRALSAYTGNNTVINGKDFQIFPNPANQEFSINFPLGTKNIKIYNSIGLLMQIKSVEGQTIQNFKLIENGIYFVQISTDKQEITKKLIIRK